MTLNAASFWKSHVASKHVVWEETLKSTVKSSKEIVDCLQLLVSMETNTALHKHCNDHTVTVQLS